MRNIWILGGTGFIGTSLLDSLSADPRNRLHLLVHKKVPYRKLEKFDLISGSLDRLDLTWFDRYPADVVFHLARMAGPGPVRRKLAAYRGERANNRILQYFGSLEKPPVIVYVSGSLMYGDLPGPIPADESSPLNPVAFARHYERAERPFTKGAEKAGLSIKLVRPGWIVGPGSWFRVFYWEHFLKTGRVPVYGNGNQLMSVIQLEDLGGIIGKVPDMAPGVLNVFSGDPLTQKEFSTKMAKILGAETENIPLNRIRNKYGKAEAEALGASIPLNTRYPGLWKEFDFKYPKPEDMLVRTISLLKGEQGILAETPQGGPVQPFIGIP